eukprot:scaffold2404_cov398-Prasinococcus_capsulatus_cf.AAC.34
MLAFGLVPVLDMVLPFSTKDLSKRARELAQGALRYRIPLYVWVPSQYYSLYHCFCNFAAARGALESTGWVLACGILTGGVGINIAHELLHRSSQVEQMGARVLLVPVFYMHWFTDHKFGHHKMVSTLEDASSAPYGMSFYRFWPRTVLGTFTSALNIERARLLRKRKPVFSLRNSVILGCVCEATLLATVATMFGRQGVTFLLLQALVAFTLLELVNYVEHYGLERKVDQSLEGHPYEEVSYMHSWSASQSASSAFLFRLTRHTDHHMNSAKRFQVLEACMHAPQMPTGYPGMMLLALVPAWWRSIMDRLIDLYIGPKSKTLDIEVRKVAIAKIEKETLIYASILAGITVALTTAAAVLCLM